MVLCKFDNEDFGAILSRVSRDLPGASQLMELKVWLDQLRHSMSFSQSCGLPAALQSWLANRRVIVVLSPLIVRLALEAGMNGTILDGSE